MLSQTINILVSHYQATWRLLQKNYRRLARHDLPLTCLYYTTKFPKPANLKSKSSKLNTFGIKYKESVYIRMSA